MKPDEECWEDGVDISHGDIDEKDDVYSPHDCQTFCRENSQCAMWSYRKDEKKCYSKTLNHAQRSTNIDAIIGPPYCPGNY